MYTVSVMMNRLLYCSLSVFIVECVLADDGSQPKFNIYSSDFAEIVTTTSFVDKSSFIKTFIEDHGIVVITAPHRFGKSSNLNMIQKFLEIEVDVEGNRKTKNTDIHLPVKDTDNYVLFVGNKLKIAENKTFMDCHFGKSPVIRVDFEFDNVHIMSYDIAVNHFKYIIHRSYVEHHYLIKSHRLSSEDKFIVKNWCSTVGYSKMTEEELTDGLKLLSRFLYRHYEKRRSFVLIDNFDSPVVNAILFSLTEDIMGGVYRLLSSIILKVLQNNFHAHRGLITGISYLAGSPALYSLGYISVRRFLDDHMYAGFHGFTTKEIKDTFSKEIFNINATDMEEKVKCFYGGYTSFGNVTLHNPWSVINFLLIRELRGFWKGPGVHFNFDSLMKIRPLRKEVDLLLKCQERKVRLKNIYAPDDVIRLRDLIRRPDLHLELHSSDSILTFLLELGYLTYVPTKQPFLGKKLVRIPNKEMRNEISRYVNKYTKNYGSIKFQQHYR